MNGLDHPIPTNNNNKNSVIYEARQHTVAMSNMWGSIFDWLGEEESEGGEVPSQGTQLKDILAHLPHSHLFL